MPWKHPFRVEFLLTISLVGMIFCGASAEDKKAGDKAPDKLSGWQKLFRNHAAGYKFAVEGADKGEVKLVPEPILQ